MFLRFKPGCVDKINELGILINERTMKKVSWIVGAGLLGRIADGYRDTCTCIGCKDSVCRQGEQTTAGCDKVYVSWRADYCWL